MVLPDITGKRRVLVYALPGSGGSFCALAIGSQEPGWIILPDLYSERACLELGGSLGQDAVSGPFIAKTSPNTRNRLYSLSELQNTIQPDMTILVSRAEVDIVASINRRRAVSERKEQVSVWGHNRLRDMFRLFAEAVYAGEFDAVVQYEDVRDADPPVRSIVEVVEHNLAAEPWCCENRRPQQWGIGGIQEPGLSEEKMAAVHALVRGGRNPKIRGTARKILRI